MDERYIRWAWRLLIGGVFIFTGVAKLAGGYHADTPQTIYDAVVQRGPIYHYLLVGGELLLGLWVLSGIFTRSAAIVCVGVLALFSGVLLREIWSERPRPCGCAVQVLPGNDPATIRRQLTQSVARNCILMLAGVWLALIASPATKPTPPDMKKQTGPDSLDRSES